MADSYDRAKERNSTYYSALKRCIHQAVPVGYCSRVLEVGCGTGQVLASLNPCRGVGIDISRRMIEVAQTQFADQPGLTFKVHDAHAAHELGTFDAVISADVLEHVVDWRAVVASMVQATSPGGVVAITTPNPGWTLPLWILEKAQLKMPEGPHRFVSARRIADELNRQGCDHVKASTHLMVPAHLAGLGPRLSQYAEHMPVLNRFGVIQMIVAVRA